MRKKPIPHMCITCQHHDYEHFRCEAKGNDVSYDYSFEANKCKAWELHDNYKKGGKFYGMTEDENGKVSCIS